MPVFCNAMTMSTYRLIPTQCACSFRWFSLHHRAKSTKDCVDLVDIRGLSTVDISIPERESLIGFATRNRLVVLRTKLFYPRLSLAACWLRHDEQIIDARDLALIRSNSRDVPERHNTRAPVCSSTLNTRSKLGDACNVTLPCMW